MKSSAGREGRVMYALVLIFALLATGILLAGYVHYQHCQKYILTEVDTELSTVAKLKVDELTQYRNERLGDGSIFSQNASFSALVRRLLERPEDPDAQRQLRSWATNYVRHYHYDSFRLLDAGGVTRLSLPAGAAPVAALISQRVPEILRTGQVTFQDFYRNEHDQRIYLAILTPVFDEGDARRPLGVVCLCIDPSALLYPFVQHWPTVSRTAETLLVRRDGNEVLFLNDLLHPSNAALVLRIPLAKTNVCAVQAVLESARIAQSVDYRGKPVIAATRLVPASPWALVAKIDCAEVDQPITERLWQEVFGVGVLLLCAGSGVVLVWRQQRVRFYRERAQLAEALRETEGRLDFALEATQTGAWYLDLRDQTAQHTLMHDRIFGYATLLPRWTYELFLEHVLPEDRPAVDRSFHAATAAQSDWSSECRIRRADGAVRWIWVGGGYERKGEGKPVRMAGLVQDITEHKTAEAQLQRTLADLARSNRELEQFACVASHDLQEPLRMVSMFTQQLAQRYASQLDERAQKYIHYAVDGASRMKALIEDLLAYARAGAPDQPLETTSAPDALDAARRNLAALIQENHASITQDDLPAVCAIPSQLTMVFQNLLANAIKFHGPDLPRIHVSAREQGGEWLFSVQDNGIGIEPQHAERVFGLFERLHTREEYPGTGIGLALCKRVVERHGGKIWFASEPGQGTTFFFTVPKQSTPMDDQPTPTQELI